MVLRDLKWILGAVCLLSFGAHAEWESRDALNAKINTFLQSTLRITSDEKLQIDIPAATQPLQLTKCAQTIAMNIPGGAQADVTSVEVSCPGINGWHIYIPVDVQVLSKVAIAKRTVPAGEVFSNDDVDFAYYNKNRLYGGYFTNPEEIIGNLANHIVPQGTVLNKHNVQLPLIVHRNQTVSLSVQIGNLMVSMQGIAHGDGAMNDTIKVLNPSSKRVLDAVVIGPNQTKVIG